MKSSDQRGQNVRVLQIIIVVRSVQVRGHGADKLAAILPAVSLAHFQTGDLGNGVPLVGRLQRAAQQVFLFERLGRQLGIDAGAPQEEQLLDPGLPSLMNNIVLYLQVLVNEFRRQSVIGQDASHFGCRKKNKFGFGLRVKFLHRGGVQQVKLSARRSNETS